MQSFEQSNKMELASSYSFILSERNNNLIIPAKVMKQHNIKDQDIVLFIKEKGKFVIQVYRGDKT